MDIDVRFERYIEDHKLFTKEDKLLVAVSGGKDSMLLLTLLAQYGVSVEAAHCNFELRGEESDGDEGLVRTYCDQLGVPLHIRRFDTISYANSHKISIQMAARELRYDWFEMLRQEVGCDYIAVAQHKNDHVETVLLNLSRGTGLLGLQGILPKRDNVLRPLLFLTAAEVLSVVESLDVPYRDDSSNFSNKYARNKIRLDIIPQFEQLNPDFVSIMEDNIVRFQDAQGVLSLLVAQKRDELFVQIGEQQWEISKEAIKAQGISLLYYVFEPYGFSRSVLDDMLRALDAESGRVFLSEAYELLVDRRILRLRRKENSDELSELSGGEARVEWGDYIFTARCSADISVDRNPDIALLDYDKLIFPLTVRSWQEGDVFQPLGMTGTKKVSDFFIQKKINLFDKKNIPIVVNGNGELLWIATYQLDDRYKITENTQKVLKLVCNIR
ncbi:tRNA lysidine(34) synthetase TilS [Sphingobacterium faecale]|uniref:tRNA(Ile)-lysidine synthase n=1 Tax=Sphingobacterium faecale TaxID=2803775 RepID=A0ABS1QZJ1_9SPHI|nr:tRNA lysidine(34) synthetase TilS [Sphingobacterium faecale]MBL1407851.1 tRNA lysidine(34) synthetase TilS [Sphingobacterium faecale]